MLGCGLLQAISGGHLESKKKNGRFRDCIFPRSLSFVPCGRELPQFPRTIVGALVPDNIDIFILYFRHFGNTWAGVSTAMYSHPVIRLYTAAVVNLKHFCMVLCTPWTNVHLQQMKRNKIILYHNL